KQKRFGLLIHPAPMPNLSQKVHLFAPLPMVHFIPKFEKKTFCGLTITRFVRRGAEIAIPEVVLPLRRKERHQRTDFFLPAELRQRLDIRFKMISNRRERVKGVLTENAFPAARKFQNFFVRSCNMLGLASAAQRTERFYVRFEMSAQFMVSLLCRC